MFFEFVAKLLTVLWRICQYIVLFTLPKMILVFLRKQSIFGILPLDICSTRWIKIKV